MFTSVKMEIAKIWSFQQSKTGVLMTGLIIFPGLGQGLPFSGKG